MFYIMSVIFVGCGWLGCIFIYSFYCVILFSNTSKFGFIFYTPLSTYPISTGSVKTDVFVDIWSLTSLKSESLVNIPASISIFNLCYSVILSVLYFYLYLIPKSFALYNTYGMNWFAA